MVDSARSQSFCEHARGAYAVEARTIRGQPGAEGDRREQSTELEARGGRGARCRGHLPHAEAALAETGHAVALVGELGGGETCAIGGVGEARMEVEAALAVEAGAHSQRRFAGRFVLGDDSKLSREVARRLRDEALDFDPGSGLLHKLEEHRGVVVPARAESCEGAGCERTLSIATALAECIAHQREAKVSPMEAAEGARFTLRLEREDAGAVVYKFDAELGEVPGAGSVRVELETGAVTLESEPAVPGWLESTVVGLVRSLWRTRRDPRAATPWPRRLTRWRHPEGAQVR